MAIVKSTGVGQRSEQAFKSNEAEIKAIEEWLHIVDKPLSREKKDEISVKTPN